MQPGELFDEIIRGFKESVQQTRFLTKAKKEGKIKQYEELYEIFHRQMKEKEELDAENEVLKKAKESLSKDNQELINKVQALEIDNKELAYDNTRLNGKVRTLTLEKIKKTKENKLLERKYEAAQSEIEQITSSLPPIEQPSFLVWDDITKRDRIISHLQRYFTKLDLELPELSPSRRGYESIDHIHVEQKVNEGAEPVLLFEIEKLNSDTICINHLYVNEGKEENINHSPVRILRYVRAFKEKKNILSVVSIDKNFYLLKAKQTTFLSRLIKESFKTLITVGDGYGHGLLNLVQFSKNKDTGDELNSLQIFLYVVVASIPRGYYGWNKLSSLLDLRSFIGLPGALSHPSFNKKEKVLFWAYTAVSAILDGLITRAAVYRLFLDSGSSPTIANFIASTIGIADGSQFFSVEGLALAREFKRPVLDGEYKLWLKDKDKYTILVFLETIGVNFGIIFGVGSWSCLAANDVSHFLLETNIFSRNYSWQGARVISFTLSIMYFLYTYCLFGIEIKEIIYSKFSYLHNYGFPNIFIQFSEFHAYLKNRSPYKWRAVYALSILTAVIGLNAAFLDLITAYEGSFDFFTLEFSELIAGQLKGMFYSSATCFSLLSLFLYGRLLLRVVLIGKENQRDEQHESVFKTIYTIKDAFGDLTQTILLALPKIITDFVAGPNVDNFLPFWFSGIIFFVLHLYKQRGYYQLSQLKFQWCDLSCLGESEYEFKIANRPPALRDLRLSGNVVSLYFSERENELCYSVSDRNTSGRSIIDCPLRKNKSALAELAGLIRSQRENKSFNDLSDQHQAAIRAEIEENIFLGKPHVLSSTFFLL